MLLAVLGWMFSFSFAQAEMEMSGPKGKNVMVTGILVDTNCYLKDGHTTDDHDAMKKCGRDCLRDGLPAGVLVGKKLLCPYFSRYGFLGFRRQNGGDFGDPNTGMIF